MLTKLRIKNFKCLQDTGELNIRPLTFFVGPNSSGKSSVLQFLLMLRQTIDSTDIENPLATRNGWVELGGYKEFIFRKEEKRDLEVELAITGPGRQVLFNASFFYEPETARIRLKQSNVSDGPSERHLVLKEDGETYQATFSAPNEEGLTTRAKPVKFHDVAFGLVVRSPERAGAFRVMRSAWQLENEFRRLFYIGPVREVPKRVYVTSGQAPQDVGVRGERAVDVLWYTERNQADANGKQLLQQVAKWTREFGIADDVRLDRIRENYYSLIITDPATAVQTNLADIGFGASQTLPIIIESFYAPAGSTLLIEQPEIHLHPKAQAVLGDLFIDAARDGRRSFIVETHSEHLLARVRRRIAEKAISKDQVAIYYFNPTPEGTAISQVTLNDLGQYESFPDGFFEEDVKEAFEHIKAIHAAGTKEQG